MNSSYVLYKLRGRLQYLETERPMLFEVTNFVGHVFYCNTQKNFDYYKSKGFKTRVQDLGKEIESVKKSIIYYELKLKLDELEDMYNTSVRYYRQGAKIPDSKFKELEKAIDKLERNLKNLKS
jgi:hypothetical protein